MTFLAAIGGASDKYRKPNPLMWRHFCDELNGKLEVNLRESFYCGDAAGRSATKTSKKDHSADDKIFAHAIGLNFQTPESFFLGETLLQKSSGESAASSLMQPGRTAFSQVVDSAPAAASSNVSCRPQEVIVMVGGPGSGKSTYATTKLKEYKLVNCEQAKSKQSAM